MTVAVVNQWSGAAQTVGSFIAPQPAIQNIAANVANSDGNWLVAVMCWQQAPLASGIVTTMSVTDDANNYWVPVGAPSGTSSALGQVRCSVWAAPAARVARTVYAAPTAFYQAGTLLVLEVSGLSNYLALGATVATGFGNAGTTLTSAISAPSGQSLVITAAASDNQTFTTTLSGTGWTGLTSVTASNGVNHASDCKLTAGYQVTSSSTSATYTASGSLDLSTITVALLTSVAAPNQPNSNWPYSQLQIAPGAGVSTPADQLVWVDISGRDLDNSENSGTSYELATIQAAQHSVVADNNDGVLTPTNSASPYFGQLDPYTPIRRLATWGGRTYPLFRAFVQNFGQTWDNARYGLVTMPISDVWSLLVTSLQAAARAEILQDQPYGFWPLSDAAGSTSGQNIAPGNQLPVQQIQAKTVISGNAASFGNSTDGVFVLDGDPGVTVWTQTGLLANTTPGGFTLQYADSNMPGLSGATGGITVEMWISMPGTAAQPTTGIVLWILKGPGGAMAQLSCNNAGNLLWTVWDKVTKATTVTTVNNTIYWPGSVFHIALTLTQTSWQIWVDAGSSASASGTCNLGTTALFMSWCGQADRFFSGDCFNGALAYLVLFDYVVPYSRILSHWFMADSAFVGADTPGGRVERLLGYAGYGVPRGITVQAPQGGVADRVMPCTDIGGSSASVSSSGQFQPPTGGQQLGQAIVNITSSDGGWLYVGGDGALHYRSRPWGYDLPTVWTLGELATAGEIPYQGDIAFDHDATKIADDVQITPLNATAAIVATNPATIAQAGDVTYTQTSYLANFPGAPGWKPYAASIGDQANWIANINGVPQLRVSQITVDAASYPAAWPLVLGIRQGDFVLANRRPWGAPIMSAKLMVLQVQRQLTFSGGVGKVTLLLGPVQTDILTCDDAVRGLLNGTNPLGW